MNTDNTDNESNQELIYKKIDDENLKLKQEVTILHDSLIREKINNEGEVRITSTSFNLALKHLREYKIKIDKLLSKDIEYNNIVLENTELKKKILELNNQLEVIEDESPNDFVENFIHENFVNMDNDEYLKNSKLKTMNDDDFYHVLAGNNQEIIDDEATDFQNTANYDEIKVLQCGKSNIKINKDEPMGISSNSFNSLIKSDKELFSSPFFKCDKDCDTSDYARY